MVALLRADFSAQYVVGPRYKEYWDAMRATHSVCPMLVFDEKEDIVGDPAQFESKLVGALIEVTFSLKHYYMAATSTRTKAYDTFSAKIESISVLSPPPVVRRSPYKETIYTRKPKPMPQMPTRGEQVQAAKVFGPMLGKIPQPNFSLGEPGAFQFSYGTTCL